MKTIRTEVRIGKNENGKWKFVIFYVDTGDVISEEGPFETEQEATDAVLELFRMLSELKAGAVT